MDGFHCGHFNFQLWCGSPQCLEAARSHCIFQDGQETKTWRTCRWCDRQIRCCPTKEQRTCQWSSFSSRSSYRPQGSQVRDTTAHTIIGPPNWALCHNIHRVQGNKVILYTGPLCRSFQDYGLRAPAFSYMLVVSSCSWECMHEVCLCGEKKTTQELTEYFKVVSVFKTFLYHCTTRVGGGTFKSIQQNPTIETKGLHLLLLRLVALVCQRKRWGQSAEWFNPHPPAGHREQWTSTRMS